MNKPITRVLFSCVLSLFLAFVSLGIGVCYLGKTALFSKHALIRISTQSGYAQQLYKEIAWEWGNLFAITGVETPEAMMSLLTLDAVTADALAYIAAPHTVETQQLSLQLEHKVREYAYAQTVQVGQEEILEENITDLVIACADSYQKAIEIPSLPTILNSFDAISSKLTILGCVLGFAFTLLSGFLLCLQRKRIFTLYYIAIAAAAAGLVLLGIPAIAAHYHIMARLPFTDSALKTLIIAFGTNALQAAAHCGSVYMLAAGFSLCAYWIASIVATFRKTSLKKQ